MIYFLVSQVHHFNSINSPRPVDYRGGGAGDVDGHIVGSRAGTHYSVSPCSSPLRTGRFHRAGTQPHTSRRRQRFASARLRDSH
jgi:hypothetical protein